MSRQLAALLAAYEAERAMLSAQLAEYLDDADYKRARMVQRGLHRVNQQLRTLHNLQDALHDEKQETAQFIERLQQLLQDEAFVGTRDYFAEQLLKKQAKLTALQAQPLPPRRPPSHVLSGLLRKVLAGELPGFTLVLNQAQQLSCDVRLARRTLILTIPELRRHTAAYTLEKRHLKQLSRLGFRVFDRGDKLLLFMPFATAADVALMQQQLARLAFEVLYFKELAGQAFVRYVG